jgi:hypothetical protein
MTDLRTSDAAGRWTSRDWLLLLGAGLVLLASAGWRWRQTERRGVPTAWMPLSAGARHAMSDGGPGPSGVTRVHLFTSFSCESCRRVDSVLRVSPEVRSGAWEIVTHVLATPRDTLAPNQNRKALCRLLLYPAADRTSAVWLSGYDIAPDANDHMDCGPMRAVDSASHVSAALAAVAGLRAAPGFVVGDRGFAGLFDVDSIRRAVARSSR